MSADGSENVILSLPRALLEPLKQLAGLYDQYGSVPRAIFGLISLYILNGILGIFQTIAGAFLSAFDIVVQILGFIQRALVGPLSAAGAVILNVQESLNRILFDVAQSAGPFGPVLVVAFVSVSLYLLYRLSIALLGEIPGGSTAVDLLRLR